MAAGFPWRAMAVILALTIVSPYIAGALALTKIDNPILIVAHWWFFALPTFAYEIGVPTDAGEGAIMIVYALQYLLTWWAWSWAADVLREPALPAR